MAEREKGKLGTNVEKNENAGYFFSAMQRKFRMHTRKFHPTGYADALALYRVPPLGAAAA
jgi:hypothetical protein